ncbi:MAG TPA: metallophosphoesterase [Bacteroidia bacterium]|jgi:predicted MPP superfamily phosphohydrolase|nr:metallophosphoesterase [Bacteroidia bacterium]
MKKHLLLLLLAGSAFRLAAAPGQIRWGSSGDPLNGLTITWSNSGAADSIRWGYTTGFEKGKFPGVKRAGYNTGVSFFKYVFGTANASSTIYYELFDSSVKSWGTQQTFATAPASNSTDFTFCALGDCRDDLNVLQTVSNLASARKSALTVFNGDLTYDGNVPSEYDDFFSYASNFLANNVVYHAQGNHDAGSTPMYQNMFDLPTTSGSNLYYSFKYGNAIFITLNTESPSGQTTWLNNTLAAAAADPSIVWKIISFHKPFFTTGQHEGDMNSYRSSWWKAFDTYGVDLVLNGHDHNYQRSKPVNLSVSTTTPVSQYGSAAGQGRCEIVCGGAGAGLYTAGSNADAWAMNIFNSTYNYVYCEVKGCQIVITAYDDSNTSLDSFTLDKSGTSVCKATGVKEAITKFNPISVAPNPSEGPFTLHYRSELKGDALIKIFDMTGKEVASEKASKTSETMDFNYDLSGRPKGIYTVSIIMGSQRDNSVLIVK